MQLPLDSSELLTEKELFLLLGKGLVDGRGDLFRDFRNGGLFEEYISC